MPGKLTTELRTTLTSRSGCACSTSRHPGRQARHRQGVYAEDPDGKVRVWAKAKAYRTPDDPLPGVGHVLPRSTRCYAVHPWQRD